MNYGETLAFWYFRLNGFFPLRDFVLHRGEGLARTSDCDLLALRFPHVYEEIGGQAGDWDEARFREWGIDLARPIVVIAQVKTGRERTCGAAFTEERLTMALRRVGLWDTPAVHEIVQSLDGSPLHSHGGIQVVKVLVADNPREQPKRYRTLPLRAALGFLRDRVAHHRGAKQADRLFFHDELIQFLASGEGIA